MNGADGRVVSFTVTRYSPRRAVLGALHMATHRAPLARVRGLRFWQLVGLGSGIGFSRTPDLLHWGLFAVWDSAADWDGFVGRSGVMGQYRYRGEESYSLLLAPISAHGRWDGVEPFGRPTPARPSGGGEPLVVLTRARIRLTRQLRFWDAVPRVDATLRGNPGVLLTFGFGETPYLRQATLSVWRTESAMREWAYGSPQHAEVVHRTRSEAWYAEELFARFRLLRTDGTFQGSDPLKHG